MGMDWNDILYSPIYAMFATEALITPSGQSAVIISVVDKTAGFDVNLNTVELPSLKPVVFAMMAELAAKGLTLDSVRDATLQLGLNRWLIKSVKQRPGPDGKGSGEAMFILQKDDA